MDEPVAIPSSTRITVRPRPPAGGRRGRRARAARARAPRAPRSPRSPAAAAASPHHVGVQHAHAARCDRAERQLLLPRDAELAHRERVERRRAAPCRSPPRPARRRGRGRARRRPRGPRTRRVSPPAPRPACARSSNALMRRTLPATIGSVVLAQHAGAGRGRRASVAWPPPSRWSSAGLDPYVLERAPELTRDRRRASACTRTPCRRWAISAPRSFVRTHRRARRRRRVAPHGRRQPDSSPSNYGGAWPSTTASSTSACTAPTSSKPRAAGALDERVRLNSRLVGLDETARRRDRAASRTGIEVTATCSSAPTACAPPSAPCSSASRRRASQAWRRGAAHPDENMPPGFGTQIVVWSGRGRHCMTYPVRDDLCAAQRLRARRRDPRSEEWGPSGDLDDLRRSFADARARRARPHRPHLRGRSSRRSTSATRCRCGAPTASSSGRRRPSRAVQRGPGGGAWRSRTRSCSPRASARDDLAGVRRSADYAVTAPAADAADARLRADEPQMFNEPDPSRCAHGTVASRDAADRSARRVAVRLALRPRPAAAAAEPPLRRRTRSAGLRRPEAQRAHELWARRARPSRTARGCGSASARATSASRDHVDPPA